MNVVDPSAPKPAPAPGATPQSGAPPAHARGQPDSTWSDTWHALNERAADTVRATGSTVLDALLLTAWIVFEHYPVDWIMKSMVQVPTGASDSAWTVPVVRILLQFSVIIPLSIYFVRDCAILIIQSRRKVRAEMNK